MENNETISMDDKLYLYEFENGDKIIKKLCNDFDIYIKREINDALNYEVSTNGIYVIFKIKKDGNSNDINDKLLSFFGNSSRIREINDDVIVSIRGNDLAELVSSEIIPIRNAENKVEESENRPLTIDDMTGNQFEDFCCCLLEAKGYNSVKNTSNTANRGVDILANKDGISYAIQCKCYSGNIGNHAIQEVYSGRAIYHANIAVVLTNQYFTSQAKEDAEALNVVLWDRDYLFDMINSLNGNFDYSVSYENINYSTELLYDSLENNRSIDSYFDDSRDKYFDEAARLLIDKKKGSIGMIQRYFKIGFNRAMRIMDQLEEAGVVGPEDGTKPRKVIMTLNEYENNIY